MVVQGAGGVREFNCLSFAKPRLQREFTQTMLLTAEL